MHYSSLLVLLSFFFTNSIEAREFFVSPDGADSYPGTRGRPMRTIAKALEDAVPGDFVLLLGGRYLQPMVVSGVTGRSGKPVTISAAPGESVIFDGTDPLPDRWIEVTPDSSEGKLIQKAQWKRIEGRKLYSLRLNTPIYALVYDGKLMSDARWPNARWDDPWRQDRYNVLRRATEKSKPGELHDGFPTENTLEESSLWVHYDRGTRAQYREMLSDTGLDFTGSVVVISYAWGSFATSVTEHRVGADSFKFDTKFSSSGSIQEEAVSFVVNRIEWHNPNRFKQSGHGGIHYFLEGLPALDTEEEWWYHEATQTLYFVSPNGQKPEAGKARGKRRDYQMTISNSSFVHFIGVDFFGGAIQMENCDNSRIEDCTFRFSAYNKFSVGNFDIATTARIVNLRTTAGEERLYNNALVNCQFTYLDGNAFEGRSTGLTIDNILIYRTQQTTLGLDSRSMSIDRPLVVRRCTIRDVGASVGIKGGGIDSVYELNNISRFGGLQYDGAALQMGGRERYLYRYNWSHDHPKRSYRFDAGSYPSYSNAYGEMSHNIAWNTPGGFAIKGDDHLIYNNVLIGDSKFELFNMARWASENQRTVVANNVVPRLSAGMNDRVEGSPRKPAEVLSNLKANFMDDPRPYLRDPDNLDFRPKKNSPLIDKGHRLSGNDVPWKTTAFTGTNRIIGRGPDIGAYEYGDLVYWIPGFKFPNASTPVPPDGTLTAKPDCDLMWLGGYKANIHHLYFGSTKKRVREATKNSPEFQKTFEGESNIFDPGQLRPGQSYYWRVDVIRAGKFIKGDIWQFSVAQ